MKAKDIKPGVVYGFQRGRGEYATIQAMALLAPADADHLYQTASYHRRPGAPAFTKAMRSSKPKKGRGWNEASVGYPAVFGPADALEGFTLERFEAATSPYPDSESGVEFRVLTSLTAIVGPYEEAMAAHQQRLDAANEERDREQRRQAAAQQRAKKLVEALGQVGVVADTDSSYNPTGLTVSLDEADKLLALLAAQKTN
ncbi:hypothetical protein ACFYY8_31460 [Streptosporangium sp. NPDC001559]|uniref:hypothetical protein n=1 Tax=Streptosporangium sp. NPDC001559 TaxID=3366187 RepID=UPI0036EBFB85